eukprot:m.33071 g.33071  ORF g.33071 m.33071 type:complete len:491 (+) comp6428_c0_seq1:94-1566(+)
MTAFSYSTATLLVVGIVCCVVGRIHPSSAFQNPTSANCTLMWHSQTTDHFQNDPSTTPQTFQQRVFINKDHWVEGGPIFFYAGNEGDVELYVNHTGLMWEHAADFNAMLVFAEHRFYGETQLTPGATGPSKDQYKYLTHEQAMADYATFMLGFKQNLCSQKECQVIVFGGSYGGMLAAWLRMKYPHIFHGAIAASAPILLFPDMTPRRDTNLYWQVVTRDASPQGGAAEACVENIRKAWAVIDSYGKSQEGLGVLSSIFHTCEPVKDTWLLKMYLAMAFDTMAMGNFPYPSDYLSGGNGFMPAFPVRAACEQLSVATLSGQDLLMKLNDAAAVYNNVTGSMQCYSIPDRSQVEQDGIWDYQWCSELMPQETYFTMTGETDMFWDQPYNQTFINQHCMTKYNITPRTDWMASRYGGEDFLPYTSNIVFSNGLLDPWSSGGVTRNISDTVQAIIIPNGAHHIDLFFTNKEDTPDITFARQFHVANIKKWLNK